MRVLITGGAGFVGSNLAEELVNEYELVILDNFHTGSMDNLRKIESQIKVIDAPCSQIMTLGLPRVDYIFHIGIPSSTPMYKENHNLVGESINEAISVFEFAKKENVKKVVFASSSSIYNELPMPSKEDMEPKVTDYYTEARISIERLAKLYHVLYGIESVGLRFFSIYGFHEEAKGEYANVVSQFLWQMRRDEAPVLFGDGEQTRDYIFIKDVIRACRAAMNSDLRNDLINVGTGKSHSFNEVVALLNKLLGKNINPEYIENPIKNYVFHTLADTTKMRSLLSLTPTYNLADGIAELLKEE